MARLAVVTLLALTSVTYSAAPQSLDQLYEVNTGSSEVISLRGFDIDGDKVSEDKMRFSVFSYDNFRDREKIITFLRLLFVLYIPQHNYN